MRVLFLDVDGVLNRKTFDPENVGELRGWIEPELAERLSAVVKRTHAVLVMSSDWRLRHEVIELREQLHAAGVIGSLRDVTPSLPGRARWQEIDAWMREHGIGFGQVVIVDDHADMGPLHDRFVRTDPYRGLDEDAALRIVHLFNGAGSEHNYNL